MLRFHKTYFFFALILFLIEVVIALFIRDRFIRPYVGDYLVVILLYCMLRSAVDTGLFKAATLVLVVAFLVEWAQYFNLIGLLGWSHNQWANIIVGNSFAVEDLVAYTAGYLTILLAEKYAPKRLTSLQ